MRNLSFFTSYFFDFTRHFHVCLLSGGRTLCLILPPRLFLAVPAACTSESAPDQSFLSEMRYLLSTPVPRACIAFHSSVPCKKAKSLTKLYTWCRPIHSCIGHLINRKFFHTVLINFTLNFFPSTSDR